MRQLDRIKEFWGDLSGRSKKIAISVAAGLLIFSAIAAILFNRTDYAVLFSGMNEEEAQKVISLLHESDVTYRYSQDGKIYVPSQSADGVRMKMVMEGYPQSGFSYDVLLNNSGMMSTESDKETYKLYDLQDRIGKTIRNIDGVKSAVVTINLAKDSKFVLANEGAKKASAYTVVHMYNGGSPSAEQVKAIQRLIAKSVPDMGMGDVAVIDGNGIDVSVYKEEEDPTVDGTKKSEYEAMEEKKLESGIVNLLEGIYGRGNVRVRAKCVADMQRVISEEITFEAPDEINNSGYVSEQRLSSEGNGPESAVSGIPGAQSNTNIPQYNTAVGTGNDGYYSSNSDTIYGLNQKKVQGQNDSGGIVDVSIAVTINKKSVPEDSPSTNEIVRLVANAAGIDEEKQGEKITVITADFYDNTQAVETTVGIADGSEDSKKMLLLAIGGAVALLMLVIIVFLAMRSRNKRRLKQEEVQMQLEAAVGREQSGEPEEDPELKLSSMQAKENKYGAVLKGELQTFADENPEISASLLKSWLRSEDEGCE